jgi:hypothetical protein
VSGGGGRDSLDEQRVFVVAPALAPAAIPQFAEHLHRRPERADHGTPLARRRGHRRLDDVERLLDANRDVGKQLVNTLDLCRRQRHRARGVGANRVQVSEQRFHVALYAIEHVTEAPRHQSGGDDHADLRDGDGHGGDRDDAQEDVAPHH